MGISILIGILVMNAMCSNPGYWSAFEGECSTDGQEIFHPLRCVVSTMGEKPVITHANAKTPCNPIQ
jgi:hypothetical protein